MSLTPVTVSALVVASIFLLMYLFYLATKKWCYVAEGYRLWWYELWWISEEKAGWEWKVRKLRLFLLPLTAWLLVWAGFSAFWPYLTHKSPAASVASRTDNSSHPAEGLPKGWDGDPPTVRAGQWAMARADTIVGSRQPGQAMPVYACNLRLKGAVISINDPAAEVTETAHLPEDGDYSCDKFKFVEAEFRKLSHLNKGFQISIKIRGKTTDFRVVPSRYQVHSIYLSLGEKGQIRVYMNGPDVQME